MPIEIFTAEHLAYYLIAVNFIVFASFGIDKALAEAGARRISEATLLTWALICGGLLMPTPGPSRKREVRR